MVCFKYLGFIYTVDLNKLSVKPSASPTWKMDTSNSTAQPSVVPSLAPSAAPLLADVSDVSGGWTLQTAAGRRDWMVVASSSDSTRLAAAVYGGIVNRMTSHTYLSMVLIICMYLCIYVSMYL
jgi:hypothetical protein